MAVFDLCRKHGVSDASLPSGHPRGERTGGRVKPPAFAAWPYDRVLRELLTELARERRRLGYRRLHAPLRREDLVVNDKRLFRLYREDRLGVRRRGRRKRALGTRAPMHVALRPHDRWDLDFVSDQLTDGRRFRILTIVDNCSRENIQLIADTSLSGVRVATKLDG